MSIPYAFVTLVTSDHYLPGALTVAAALKDVHHSPPVDPEVPFQTVCIVTPEVLDINTVKHLRRAFDVVIGVEVIEVENEAGLALLAVCTPLAGVYYYAIGQVAFMSAKGFYTVAFHDSLLSRDRHSQVSAYLKAYDGRPSPWRPDLHSVLTKLHIFRLTQYKKIIFLDADVLPIRPLSHLFKLPYDFAAVPDVGWPDIFNSGVMVCSPGEENFKQTMDIAKGKGSWDGGDQGVLNEWRGDDWHRLSFTYNTTPTAAYTYAPAYERFGAQISAIHFIGPNKPWESIPYRAPGSGSSKEPSHPPSSKQRSYAYSSLVDRWFDIYDRYYRSTAQLSEKEFEVKKYESAWNEGPSISEATAEEKDETSKAALGLEDLRRLAVEGIGGSAPLQRGEGEYRSLPLEGRVDLMRPKKEKDPEAKSLSPPEPSREGGTSEDTTKKSHQAAQSWASSGVSGVPPSPPSPPLPPPAPRAAPIPQIDDHGEIHHKGHQSGAGESHQPHHHEPQHHDHHEPHEQQHQDHAGHHHHHHQQHVPHVQPPRPASPPMLSWNPAVEPPPNTAPPASAFRGDAYFPNVWDQPHSTRDFGYDTDKPAETQQFFEPPPPTHIPQRLVQEGHYANVTGHASAHSPSQEQHPSPDVSKVHPVFPWESRPRYMPGRRFPEGQGPSANITYIDRNAPLPAQAEPAPPSGSLSPKKQPHSPPGGFRSYANAWDNVPSIQKYAAKLVKPPPSVVAPMITSPRSGHSRKRSDSFKSWEERADATSMDGDDEDDGDDDEATRLDDSSVERSGRPPGRDRSLSSSGTRTPRSAKVKKEYRTYGVQTIPKEVRSFGVQVSTPTGSKDEPLSSKKFTTSPPTMAKLPSRRGTRASPPKVDPSSLPKPPSSIEELRLGQEQMASASPGVVSAQSFIKPGHPSLVTQSQNVNQSLPTGTMSPRIHDSYNTGSQALDSPRSHSPSSVSPVATPGPISSRTNVPFAPSKLSISQPPLTPIVVARTSSTSSSGETLDSSIGPISPRDSLLSPQISRKPAARIWNPATGVDVFKRGSEEVLARFLRMGSWEEDAHAHGHHHAHART
ncbi:nucleotide-diphospho-sugar transferase [Rickenella mellea]|uniref:Nucleotide-diphospho-sugar transferase n=1 Tax=Rickenella mellea TaxID=50990 RepID=A0A4Y7QKX8_9AGAM|nr:nucleotide-diphospho-sugar transferase [Rickenella mellea]